MVIVKEYRVTLPFTLEEYMIAQLYTVLAALKEKGTFDDAEVVKNESFTDHPLQGGRYNRATVMMQNRFNEVLSTNSLPNVNLLVLNEAFGIFVDVVNRQFTHKIYRVEKKVPAIMRWLVKNALTLHERSWNSYPYTLTFMGQADPSKPPYVITESIHLADRGNTENPLNLPADKLKQREVIYINIGAEKCEYATEESCKPYLFKSKKTGRGPFAGNWRETVTPVMTCYKLVTVDIKLLAFQNKVENYVHRYQARIMANLHRNLVCLMDEWAGKTMADIREMEAEYALSQVHLASDDVLEASSSVLAKNKSGPKS